ncbi:hypothetical protein FRB90_012490, partial [Tulasnella sp. 427]
MPTPRRHYRIALGEYNGDHSWVINSAKGIKWHHVPNELATLLQSLSANELLDFDLGTGGRWIVKYRKRGLEKQALSAGLLADLRQGANLKLDRLTLGPDSDHWGVRQTADGSFERFLSVSNSGRFEKLLDSKTPAIKSNNQISFVSLGCNGDWAFSVNGHLEHRCGNPFQKELAGGWKVRKRVSTVALSPLARVWIIVWEDGTLSHNLPLNIANDVGDYCQIQHSLKNASKGSGKRGPKPKPAGRGRQSLSAGNSSAQTVQRMALTQTTNNHTANSARSLSTQFGQLIKSLFSAPVVALISLPTPNVTKTVQPATSTRSTTAARRASSQAVQSANYQPPPALKALQAPTAAPVVPILKTTATAAPALASQSTSAPIDSVRALKWLGGEGNASWRWTSSHYVPPPPPPKKITTTLRLLDRSSFEGYYEYEKISGLFRDGWQHSNKICPRVLRIFAVSLPDYLSESFESYRTSLGRRHGWGGINEKYLFHGTYRYCSVGEQDDDTELCEHSMCSLCSILRTSFLVSKAISAGKAFKRFGPGIYTSSVSSKADDYMNTPVFWENKVMIVARVALGKGSVHYLDTAHLMEPPSGYDSVLGEVGGSLNYDEQVLYKDEAIRPAYIVTYEKPEIIAPGTRPVFQPAPSQIASKNQPAPAATTIRPSRISTAATTSSASSGDCTIMHNIPNELIAVLQKLSVNELLDFDLGTVGRWYVRYRTKGPEKQELSAGLSLELAVGYNAKLDRLSLGPNGDHWGVRKVSGGSFGRFRSLNSNYGRFEPTLDSKTADIKSNNQIGFVCLGHSGDWALSVNWHVQHRCGKPFQTELAAGWKVKKRVSTIVLSPIARVWIIVWDDGSLSHNLPFNIANDVDDYCRIQHSFKSSPGPSNNPKQKGTKKKAARVDHAVSVQNTGQQQDDDDGSAGAKGASTSRPSVPTLAAPSCVFPPPPRPPPKKTTTTLRRITQSDWKDDGDEYQKDVYAFAAVANLFKDGWKHPHKSQPKIIRIFAVELPDHLNKSYETYKGLLERRNYLDGANEKLVFHGTVRYCSLGDGDEDEDGDGNMELCEAKMCCLCSILRTSFLVSKATSAGKAFKRQGVRNRDLYLQRLVKVSRVITVVVDKLMSVPGNRADDYSNTPIFWENKVVIVARVALGKSSVLYRDTVHLTEPPSGYDSVLGEVGVSLNYDEQVLYKNDAIRPAYVVVYKKPTPIVARPPPRPAPTTNSSASSGG